jgi:hypothetical protein
VGRDELRARQARRVGAVGLACAVALPGVLWWDVVADIWATYRFELQYFLGWTPWALMLGGVLFFIPVALSEGRDPEGRFYPRARNAYYAWGASLYVLGFLLATQVARLHDSGLTA